MPEHTSWLTFLLEHIKETLSHNASLIGEGFVGHTVPTWHSFEPIIASLLVVVLVLLVAKRVGGQLNNVDGAVVPDGSLTLRTFVEAFLGYFYNMAKDVMDAKRAKKYFPLIGASALFVFTSNIMALLPTFPVATGSLSITLGCALVVFVLFNLYGLMTHGMAYVAHFAGPAWYLAWLIFPIEAHFAVRTSHHFGRTFDAQHVGRSLDLGHLHEPRAAAVAAANHDARCHRRVGADARFHAAHLHLHRSRHRARSPLKQLVFFGDTGAICVPTVLTGRRGPTRLRLHCGMPQWIGAEVRALVTHLAWSLRKSLSCFAL